MYSSFYVILRPCFVLTHGPSFTGPGRWTGATSWGTFSVDLVRRFFLKRTLDMKRYEYHEWKCKLSLLRCRDSGTKVLALYVCMFWLLRLSPKMHQIPWRLRQNFDSCLQTTAERGKCKLFNLCVECVTPHCCVLCIGGGSTRPRCCRASWCDAGSGHINASWAVGNVVSTCFYMCWHVARFSQDLAVNGELHEEPSVWTLFAASFLKHTLDMKRYEYHERKCKLSLLRCLDSGTKVLALYFCMFWLLRLRPKMHENQWRLRQYFDSHREKCKLSFLNLNVSRHTAVFCAMEVSRPEGDLAMKVQDT